MKFYFSYFKLRFITSLQYRFAAIAGVAAQLFFGFVFIMVYLAFYESGSSNAPMRLQDLVSYMWLNQILFSLVFLIYKDNEIFDLIKTGNIAYELARPKKIYFMWFAKIIGQRLSNVTLRCVPVIIVAVLLPFPYGLGAPYSVGHFLMFLITLLVGALLMTTIILLFHILTLITLNEKGVTNLVACTADIFSGGLVPIPFFPPLMQKIANILPFRYVSDLSFRIYTNNVTISEGINGLLVQIIWFGILLWFGNFLLNKCMKKIVVQGG